MRTLEHNTIATQITGIGVVQSNTLNAWAFFVQLASKNLLLKSTQLASSSLLLKGAFVFYLYLYLYLYGNDRW